MRAGWPLSSAVAPSCFRLAGHLGGQSPALPPVQALQQIKKYTSLVRSLARQRSDPSPHLAREVSIVRKYELSKREPRGERGLCFTRQSRYCISLVGRHFKIWNELLHQKLIFLREIFLNLIIITAIGSLFKKTH